MPARTQRTASWYRRKIAKNKDSLRFYAIAGFFLKRASSSGKTIVRQRLVATPAVDEPTKKNLKEWLVEDAAPETQSKYHCFFVSAHELSAKQYCSLAGSAPDDKRVILDNDASIILRK